MGAFILDLHALDELRERGELLLDDVPRRFVDQQSGRLVDLLGGEDRFDDVSVELLAGSTIDAPNNEAATGRLRIVVKGDDMDLVGRKFSRALVALTLASVPGMFADTPPTNATVYGVYWPALIDEGVVEHRVVLEGGEVLIIASAPTTAPRQIASSPTRDERQPEASLTLALLGDLCGARSGDKGGNANVGVWTWDDELYAWMSEALTEDAVADLLALDFDVEVKRYDLPNLRALNFVVIGLLGEGVASTTREGTNVREMRYAHAVTDTAPGHASLYTGAPPHDTGIVSNERVDDEGEHDCEPLRADDAHARLQRGVCRRKLGHVGGLCSIEVVVEFPS